MSVLKKLKGLTAVVTGASSGIGLQFSRCLGAHGAALVMVSNQEAELERYSAEIAGYGTCPAPRTVCMDLCKAEASAELIYMLEQNGIQPDILINNAGIFSFDELTRMSDARIRAFTDLHVRAVTLLSRDFGRLMVQSGRGGYILNMSSMSCWMPMPGLSLYSATKAYIRVLSRSLHLELADAGVKVTVATPGGIATDLFGLPPRLMKIAVGVGAVQTPEKFVRGALRSMLRGRQQYINGLLNRIAIAAVGLLPRMARLQVKRLLLDRGVRRQ